MYLPQGYTNTTSLLTFFAVDSAGFLVDANAVEFKIVDPTGVQQFPIAGWIVATTTGLFDTGSYYAVDEVTGDAWEVPGAAAVGTWSITWRWKLESSDDWQQWSIAFDVVESRSGTTGFLGVPYRTLVTPLAIRATGLTVLKYGDVELEKLILEVQSYLETACRQAFRPEVQTFRLQGGDSIRLYLQVPIIGVDFVKANLSSQVMQQASLTVNFSRVDRVVPLIERPDPRRQPSIAIAQRANVFSPSIYSQSAGFISGPLNQEVKGVFGFLEGDGTVPAMMQRAATILVYRTAVKFKVGDVPVAAGPMTSKTVDRHSVGFANTGIGSANSALARSKEVQEIIRIYRGPIGLASPDSLGGRFY